MKSLFALISLVSLQASAAAVPAALNLHCWDHTYAYNMLEVTEANGKVEFKSTGENLSVYTDLAGFDGWGQATVTVSLPSSSCRVSASDTKLITCTAGTINVVVDNQGLDKHEHKTIPLKYATVSVSKVVAAGINFNDSDYESYELHLSARGTTKNVKLIQPYGQTEMGDQTSHCELK